MKMRGLARTGSSYLPPQTLIWFNYQISALTTTTRCTSDETQTLIQFLSRTSFQLRHRLTQQVPGHLVEVPWNYSYYDSPVLSWLSRLGCCKLIASMHPHATSSPSSNLWLYTFLAGFFYPTTRPVVRRPLSCPASPRRASASSDCALALPPPCTQAITPFPLSLLCSYKPRTICWPTWVLGQSSAPKAQVTGIYSLAAPYQSQPTSQSTAVPSY